MQPIKKITITRFRNGKAHSVEDHLVVEEPLEIRLEYGALPNRKRKKLAVTMRTPGSDEALAIGFLMTEGIIRSNKDILEIKSISTKDPEAQGNILQISLHPSLVFESAQLTRNFYTTSSCGICGKASIESVFQTSCYELPSIFTTTSEERLFHAYRQLNQEQQLFGQTGGLHAAILLDKNGTVVDLQEDVGRHNAVDKIIGNALLKDLLPLDQHLLLVSGRAGFELVQKCVMAGVRTMAAVGAPSSLAVQLARSTNMELIGFLKEGRFNRYSG